MKRKRNRWPWIIGIAVLLLIIVIIMGKSGGDDALKVAVEQTVTHTITETVTASGKIYPETEVKISPEVSGEIIELNVEEGDTVSKGQLLVKINPAVYNSIVSQAEASMQQNKSGVANSQQMSAQSKANYDQALANYNRNKKLFADKVISATEYEQIEATYKAAKAAYDASQASISSSSYGVEASAANLSQARENLLKTSIVAPRSGIISALNVKKGERVLGTSQMQGTNLLNIADMSRIELRVDVSETDIAKVKIGDTSIITADAYRNRKFTGVVSQIAVSSSTTTTTTTDQVTNYTVHILILPSSYADIVPTGKYKYPFKPGMSASVEIQTRKENDILSIPVNAVTTRDWTDSIKKKNQDNGIRQVVFVYDAKTQQVKLRDVKTGIQDNKYIQVTDGLKAGEQVVIAPYGAIARILKDATRVKTVDKDKLFEVKEEK